MDGLLSDGGVSNYGGHGPIDDDGVLDSAQNAGNSFTVIDGRGSKDVNAESSKRACVQADTEDYCAALPALSEAPVIDGELDCGLALVALKGVGWNGTNPAPVDRATTFAAAWRKDGLYIYVNVRQPLPAPHPAEQPIYCGEAIELFVDADGNVDEVGHYDRPGAMQLVVAAPSTQGGSTLEAERFVNGVSQGVWISKNLKMVMLSKGYALEAFITAADLGLWDWPSGNRVGFDIAIDIAGDSNGTNPSCSARLGQYFLRVTSPTDACTGAPWCNTRAFCTAQLTPSSL
jgi:hypothetical protein